MGRSVLAGKIQEEGSFEENGGGTLSEGTAGGIEQGAITFEICQIYVDRWIEVEENMIEKAVVDFLKYHHKLIEGASGVSVAAF